MVDTLSIIILYIVFFNTLKSLGFSKKPQLVFRYPQKNIKNNPGGTAGVVYPPKFKRKFWRVKNLFVYFLNSSDCSCSIHRALRPNKPASSASLLRSAVETSQGGSGNYRLVKANSIRPNTQWNSYLMSIWYRGVTPKPSDWPDCTNFGDGALV